MSHTPLTSDDLRVVADALDVVQDNPALVNNPVIGRIEVIRPDGTDVIGWFEEVSNDPTDCWYGFFPEAGPHA